MSVLLLPRLYFKGQMYWSTSTYNNDDYAPYIEQYNAVNADLDWHYLHEQKVETADQFKKWSITPIQATDQAEQKAPPSEWNYFGGNQCGFVTHDAPDLPDTRNFGKPPGRPLVQVTGYTNNGCQVVTADPWVGLSMQFNTPISPSKLVDVNPRAPWSSQIFADTFTLGDNKQGFRAAVAHRMHSRWLGFHNYNVDNVIMIAGTFVAVFQTVFKTADIQFVDPSPSGALQQQLQQALLQPGVTGLMLRFTAYDTFYFQGPAFADFSPGDRYSRMVKAAELYQKYVQQEANYKAGKRKTEPKRPINPAYSMTVGWIGPWRQDELTSVPGGRFLAPSLQSVKNAKDGVTTLAPTIQVQPKGLPTAYYNPDPQKNLSQHALGPAAVEIKMSGSQIDRLTIDMNATMPAFDSTGKKADFGRVQLAVVLPDGDKSLPGSVYKTPGSNETLMLAPLCDLPNDQASYEKTAGVVDVPGSALPSGAGKIVSQNRLALIVETYDPDAKTSEAVVGLIESPLTAQTDQRGIYLNEPAPPWQPLRPLQTFSVQVNYLGAPAPSGAWLAVAQYDANFALVTDKDAIVDLFYQDRNGMFHPIRNDTAVPVINGAATIGLSAANQGLPNLAFFPLESTYATASKTFFTPPDSIAFPAVAALFFTVVRVLPFHNQKAMIFENWLKTRPAPDLINRRVFDEVFGSYHLLFPVMDFIDNPAQFQQMMSATIQVTDTKLFESSTYMPVTRSLSAGQRRILELYDHYLVTENGAKNKRPSPMPAPSR